MKKYRKEIKAMEKDKLKLYALIIQYLSEEILEEIKCQDGRDGIGSYRSRRSGRI
jgi:hypothetical protein